MENFSLKNNVNTQLYLAIVFILTTVFTVNSQTESGFGIKAGVNYNANGDYYSSISQTKENPSGAIGYHIGVFGKIGDKIYLKPELMYTKTSSKYTVGDFSLQSIDAPVLFGIKVIGPISVFAGPAFQYILNSELENAKISDLDTSFTVGLNFGIGLQFENVGIDLRYERGFTANETHVILNNSTLTLDKLDTRAEQLLLSLSVKL